MHKNVLTERTCSLWTTILTSLFSIKFEINELLSKVAVKVFVTFTNRCILLGSIKVYPFVDEVDEDALIFDISDSELLLLVSSEWYKKELTLVVAVLSNLSSKSFSWKDGPEFWGPDAFLVDMDAIDDDRFKIGVLVLGLSTKLISST